MYRNSKISETSTFNLFCDGMSAVDLKDYLIVFVNFMNCLNLLKYLV